MLHVNQRTHRTARSVEERPPFAVTRHGSVGPFPNTCPRAEHKDGSSRADIGCINYINVLRYARGLVYIPITSQLSGYQVCT